MSLRPLAFLLALLPGLIAPVGMSWCTAWCTAVQATSASEPAVAKAAHGCCAQEPASKPEQAPTGPQFAKGCQACGIAPAPKSDLSKLEVAAAAASLAPPSAAPHPQTLVLAPLSFVRVDFAPPSTAGPGCAPLPLRI